MNTRPKLLLPLRLAFLVFLILLSGITALAQVNVVTQHNDLGRTGQNLSETALTPSNVNVNQFGLLFKVAVDNQVYAQPLVVSNVSIGGGTHNVVYIGTTNNSVYALDADNGTQYWHVALGTPISNANYGTGCVDINGNAGIVGTPVIDPASGTLYVVNSLNNAGAFSFMLHALNIATGADKTGSPVQITNTGFSALAENQRAALTLSNGNVLVPFSSHCDMGTYHGFLRRQPLDVRTRPGRRRLRQYLFWNQQRHMGRRLEFQRKLHQAKFRSHPGRLVYRRKPRESGWWRFGSGYFRPAAGPARRPVDHGR